MSRMSSVINTRRTYSWEKARFSFLLVKGGSRAVAQSMQKLSCRRSTWTAKNANTVLYSRGTLMGVRDDFAVVTRRVFFYIWERDVYPNAVIKVRSTTQCIKNHRHNKLSLLCTGSMHVKTKMKLVESSCNDRINTHVQLLIRKENYALSLILDQWFLTGERAPPRGESINFQGEREPFCALQHGNFDQWINQQINTFVCTAYLKSGGLETKNYFKGGVIKRLRTTVLDHRIQSAFSLLNGDQPLITINRSTTSDKRILQLLIVFLRVSSRGAEQHHYGCG